MAPSFDHAVACLLCPEDNMSLMAFDDDDGDEVANHGRNACTTYNDQEGFGGDYLTGSPSQIQECLYFLIERECEHLPRVDYQDRLKSGLLDLSLRRDAVNWMEKLLSVACLSLAAKMEETEVPLSLDLQVGEAKFVFEARTIQRMELLVLSTLKWRMQAVTPFSFIDFFLRKLHDDHPPPGEAISRAVELILRIARGTEFLGFNPSEVAAAVAVSVAGETHRLDYSRAFSNFVHVQKDRVLRCCDVIQDLGLIKKAVDHFRGPSTSCPQSPVGVLDAAASLSYRSEEMTVGSCPNSHSFPSPKRMRLSRLSLPS